MAPRLRIWDSCYTSRVLLPPSPISLLCPSTYISCLRELCLRTSGRWRTRRQRNAVAPGGSIVPPRGTL